jgi:hypothetical protein
VLCYSFTLQQRGGLLATAEGRPDRASQHMRPLSSSLSALGAASPHVLTYCPALTANVACCLALQVPLRVHDACFTSGAWHTNSSTDHASLASHLQHLTSGVAA